MLLGNASSPALTTSQAQMYLRAQMLIFTPTAAVATVQSEASVQSAINQQSNSARCRTLPSVASRRLPPPPLSSRACISNRCLERPSSPWLASSGVPPWGHREPSWGPCRPLQRAGRRVRATWS
ncbi:polyhomeotic-like protein 2 [Oncorhynchus nerka]|uniref:polyhomeotic-like protein 2 n=1 Tax=Oncorhynchus nerka TaxID=8023 RepID=UPI0011314C30|nr:polyhomeotic-like protein 2 [Oncorhynchus nerka]